MDRSSRRRTTVLTVDAGPEHRRPARFYVLMVGQGGSEPPLEDLLVPDGERLRTAHRHDGLDAAAA